MEIIVLGAGAIGSLYGAKLAAQNDVTLVAHAKHADAIACILSSGNKAPDVWVVERGGQSRQLTHLNPQLEIAGLLRTMYDPRNALSQQVSQQLEAHFGDKVYRTLVPRNVRLAEAPSYGVPAVLWDASSKGAQAYVALASEILGAAA